MEDDASVTSSSKSANSSEASKEEQKKQLSVQFKAQHGLVVAFFVLLL